MTRPRVQRRAARTLAFHAMFELESRPGSDLDSVLAQRAALDGEEGSEKLREESVHFARSLAGGALEQRDEIDRRIADVAPAFPVDTLATVDRVVLELAIYELLQAQDAPVPVIISEAMHLAKIYGGETSSRFVNGVLGTIAEGLPEEGAPTARANTVERRP